MGEHHHAHHGHDHHHDHEPAYEEGFAIDAATVSLEAHTHEQAATVSLAIEPTGEGGFAFARLVDAMTAIAREAEARGGIVGHIKAFAREGDAFAHASVTAGDLPPACEGAVQATFGMGASIQLVAIVLLVDQQELVGICKGALIGSAA